MNGETQPLRTTNLRPLFLHITHGIPSRTFSHPPLKAENLPRVPSAITLASPGSSICRKTISHTKSWAYEAFA